MLKGSEVIGKPIVSFSDGTVLEKIKDVVFDAVSNTVLAFLVDEGGLFSKARIIPFSKVKATGPDAVTVDSRSSIVRAQDDPKVQQVLESKEAVKGSKVMTEDGKYLGTITDLFFNGQSGMVEGYEVSGGLLGNALSGKSFLPAQHALKMGKDVVFVPSETIHLLEQQLGGLKGLVQKAGDKVTEAGNKAAPRLKQALDAGKEAVKNVQSSATQGVEQVMDTVRSSAAEAAGRIQNFSEEQLVGRVAAKTVRSETGSIIVAQGQLVTSEKIREARTQNKFMELAAAVGLVAASDVGSQVSGAMSAAKNGLSEGAKKAGDEIKQAFAGVREKVSDLKDRSAHKIEERRIHNAVGKPVTKVIYDLQDNIILNTGDLITHEAVEKARAANMLESLLNAVSNDKPTFSKEELRAQ